MTVRRSFKNLESQYTPSSVTNIKVPYNVLVTDFAMDVTTFDNIYDYIEPALITKTDDSVQLVFRSVDSNTYTYEEPINIDSVYSDIYDLSTKIEPHTVAVALKPDQTSVRVNVPFADTTVESSYAMKLLCQPHQNMTYSSWNNNLIWPKKNVSETSNLIEFATSISEYNFNEHDENTHEYYNILKYTPSVLTNMNKNLKIHVVFNGSGNGLCDTFNYVSTQSADHKVKHTDTPQTIIDSYYEYDSTYANIPASYNADTDSYKVNGWIVYDVNVTQYNNPNFVTDSTVVIYDEDYVINRAHVPPVKYLGAADHWIINDVSAYSPVVSFDNPNNFKHVKMLHHNHSYFKRTYSIYEMSRVVIDGSSEVVEYSDAANKQNTVENDFLVEFSGHQEVVVL